MRRFLDKNTTLGFHSYIFKDLRNEMSPWKVKIESFVSSLFLYVNAGISCILKTKQKKGKKCPCSGCMHQSAIRERRLFHIGKQ
jgi:hypothetical protein